jgi:hypothetical protein
MQDLNNNMDELFRKAAAGYPLKTDNSDWDGLASRLFHTPMLPPPAKKKSKFNKYGPPFMLILLMLVLDGDRLKETRNYSTFYPPSTLRDGANTGKNAVVLNPTNTTTKQPRSQPKLNNETPFLQATHHEPAKGNFMPDDITLNRNITSNYRRTTDAWFDKIAGKNVRTIETPDLTYNTEQTAIANKITSAGNSLPLTKTINEAPERSEKKSDSTQRSSSKIYWGIVFGPGINRVKNQKLQKPGFDIGIIAGISILKGKAAIETGLLYTQKYYFSDGKYFDMDKAGSSMPLGMDVMSVEGSSELFEVPVKFKYSVYQKNKSGIMLSTGFSSYLMTKEENDYQAMMNGSEQSMVGSYKNNKRYIAVAANISAEYNYKIGKHTRLRIEPYIQIPLKGIGIGSMPVMTTGLHVGFSRFTR